MYIKRRYGLSMIIKWTFTALTVSLLYSGLVVALGYYLYINIMKLIFQLHGNL